MKTLSDYLRPGLAIVSIGLNPSVLSAKKGFYFAHPRNRFWRALNASGLLWPQPGDYGDSAWFPRFHFGVGVGVGL
ncbi:MAG: uracil-DNA glycosylase family protein [Nitrospiraceae bacterium]